MARVIIAGASGLIGSALSKYLYAQGFEVSVLKRGAEWNPSSGVLNSSLISDCDFVVNLCGEDISDGRWTSEKKKRLRNSRVESTRLISGAVARSASPSAVTLLNASAVGIYGNRGDTLLTEDSSAGSGFLADVCREWEAATSAAGEAGTRVVNLRFGIVLSRNGGALAKMLGPFSYGLGGEIGPGTQYMSWIAIEDVVRAVDACMQSTSIEGPVNVVAPVPVTNSAFTAALAEELHRPAFARIPAFMLRMMLGEIADEGLLSSERAVPEKLLKAGFEFRYKTIREGLHAALSADHGRVPSGT